MDTEREKCELCRIPPQAVSPGEEEISFAVSGMDCADCAEKVGRALKRLRGVKNVSVSFASSKATVGYDPGETGLLGIENAVRRLGYKVKCERLVLVVAGMRCADCTKRIEESVSGIAGVCSVSANFASKKVVVNFNSDLTGPDGIVKRINGLGYAAEAESRVAEERMAKSRLADIARIAFVLLSLAADFFRLLPFDIALPAVAIGGFPIFRSAFFDLKERSVTVPVFMSIGITASLLIGEHEAALTITFFMLLAEFIEAFTTERARRAIRELMDFSPKTARVKRNGGEEEVGLDHIRVSDVVVVRTGERIPVDGEIIWGDASVSQAAITGESIPVDRGVGDAVFAGTIAEAGAIEVRTAKLAQDATLSRIIRLVEEAEGSKAPVQKFADRFSSYFAPLVILAALATYLATNDPLKAIAVVVVACPCAVALATPLAVVAGTGKAAKQGIIIKGGLHLETLAGIDTLVVDKTGTLTIGEPKVTDVEAFGGRSEDEVLRLAAIAERLSEHPLAKAVLLKARELEMTVPEPEKFKVLKGRGVIARHKRQLLLVGNRELMMENGIAIPGEIERRMLAHERDGKTALLVSCGKEICGAICVADVLREEAAIAIRKTREAGIRRIVMLTGDNPRTANAIAKQVGIGEVIAEMMPEEKLEKVREIMKGGGRVAMIGDGVNDAPALAAAHLGIAMGVAGSDAAIETADIALMKDDLSKVPAAITLGRKTFGAIRQNIAFAVVFNVVGISLAASGFLSPTLAAIAHMLPDIIVFLNSSRLIK